MGVTALTGCIGAPEEGGEDVDIAIDSKNTNYAEGAYAIFEDGADGGVTLQIRLLESGGLGDLRGATLNGLLGVPERRLAMSHIGSIITALQWETRPQHDLWNQLVELTELEAMGRSLDDGRYRLLDVQGSLDGEAFTHRAIELCWADDCLVADPVLDVQEYAENRAILDAAGWAPFGVLDPANEAVLPDGGKPYASICTLNSAPNAIGKSVTYPGYSWITKNVFGVTLVSKSIAQQQVGINCYVASGVCKSSGSATSGTSSCSANVGYSCDCDNVGKADSTGSTTKAAAETKCAHQALGSANVSWTINGSGSGFSINWSTAGSVHSNGGQLVDACSWH